MTGGHTADEGTEPREVKDAARVVTHTDTGGKVRPWFLSSLVYAFLKKQSYHVAHQMFYNTTHVLL